MKISLGQPSLKYAHTVFDIIRIFLPNLSWHELCSESSEINNVLNIKVDESWIDVGITNGPNIQEKINGLGENELKRQIKFAVYLLFTKALGYQTSPWGILTGIRPTKIVQRFWDQGLSQEAIENVLKDNFLLDFDKIEKLIEVTKLQRKYLLESFQAHDTVSIYISIPFCPTRCTYCSFPAFSVKQGSREITKYLEFLVEEIKGVGKALKEANTTIQTIYVGGGTPTILNYEQLTVLLEAIKNNLINNIIEYTFEAGRPDTIDESKLLLLKKYNITRISINPQTMWEKTLKKIGRLHTPQDIIDRYLLARKIGFEINMDLIIGLPDERLEQIKYSLEEIGKLKPDNLTLHALAIKRTAKLRESKTVALLESQAQAMFSYADQWCGENGYKPYYLYRQKQILGNQENVGYSYREKPCIYNIQMIEERQTIWGLGVGASSKIVNPLDWTLVNSYNPKDLNLYSRRIKEIIKTKVDKIQALS